MIKVVLIFVDGLGLGEDNPETNPCAGKELELLSCFENGGKVIPVPKGGFLVPTDATLGIEGIPQSATGQTTILTGINAAQLLGKHLKGFPNAVLRQVLKKQSLLKRVSKMGLRPAFINAYGPLFFKLSEKIKWRLSTTTVATLSADIDFYGISDIRERRSIYHDFTNSHLIARGFDVPNFSAEDAGMILARMADEADLVLYEYFLTDKAGHSQNMGKASAILTQLERFLHSFLGTANLTKTLVILTSDHGNVENLSVKTHTRNKVMTLLWGRAADTIKDSIKSITDITPTILHILREHQKSQEGTPDDPAS